VLLLLGMETGMGKAYVALVRLCLVVELMLVFGRRNGHGLGVGS
jgi:hypothetical protein